MQPDTAIYEHHASFPALSNVCELMNITVSQRICITMVLVNPVSLEREYQV